jgi:hypothetical protein
VHFHTAGTLADLPYLPVGAFKSNPPLALVDTYEVKRTLTSSATTGQVPSRVVLDAETAKRMTKGVTAIIKDFIGPTRRPYLVIDTPENLSTQGELGARGAAIQGLGSFATEVVVSWPGGRHKSRSGETQTMTPKRRSESLGSRIPSLSVVAGHHACP